MVGVVVERWRACDQCRHECIRHHVTWQQPRIEGTNSKPSNIAIPKEALRNEAVAAWKSSAVGLHQSA